MKKAANIKKLFDKGLLKHIFPAVYWNRIKLDDGYVEWLLVTTGHQDYQTTVDKKKWKGMPLQAQADLLNYVKNKLYYGKGDK